MYFIQSFGLERNDIAQNMKHFTDGSLTMFPFLWSIGTGVIILSIYNHFMNISIKKMYIPFSQ